MSLNDGTAVTYSMRSGDGLAHETFKGSAEHENLHGGCGGGISEVVESVNSGRRSEALRPAESQEKTVGFLDSK